MKTVKRPVRWGILGCGDVTEVKSGPAYQQVPGFELAAVMARTPNKAKDYAKRHSVERYFTDPDALINDPDIDAIYIATPPDSHMQYALDVAKAGKICSIEKPLALNYGQCMQVTSAFEQVNIPIFVAYYRRNLPVFNKIKNWIDNGELGQIRHIDWQYSRPASAIDASGTPNWRTEFSIAPGGYFDDIACHGLDILNFVCGNVKTVTGQAVNQQGLYSAYDAISASLLFESGATGTGAWNFASYGRQDRVTILGDKGRLQFGIFSEGDGKLETRDRQHTFSMSKPTPIQKDYVQAMADQLFDNKPHPSNAKTASHTSWIMDEILKQR